MDFIGDTISFIIRSPFICIGWIIVGLLAGELARRFMGSPDRSGFSDLILGFAGAIIGGFVAGLLGVNTPDGGLTLVLVNLLLAVIGACILIVIGRALRGGRA